MQINLIFIDKSHIFFANDKKKLSLLKIDCKNKNIKKFLKIFFLEFFDYKKLTINKIKLIKYQRENYVIIFLKNCKKLKDHKKINFKKLLNFKLPMVILNNLSLISKVIKNSNIIRLLEMQILHKLQLKKKNKRVYYSKDNPTTIYKDYLFLLKEIGLYYKQKIIRICLHKDDKNKVHEMIMIHCFPQEVGPLMQNKKSISFHVLYGTLELYLYKYKLKILLDKDNNISTRIPADSYRLIKSTNEFCIFIEVAEGPFKDSDTIWKKYLK